MTPNNYNPERLLLLLVFLTVGVLVFQEPLLEKKRVIGPNDNQLRFELDTDNQDGGNSHVTWVNKDQLKWRCQLGQGWAYPFCGMQIYFSDSYMRGADLSGFNHLNLHLRYAGSAESLRVYLRNSNPAYTQPDEIRSTKFNMVELDTRNGPHYQDIKLSYFSVADWWEQLYDLDLRLSTSEFSNVGLIEIQTGTGLKEGVHEFDLESIELVGARVETENLYLGIILIWICTILIYLAARIRMLTMAVRISKEKETELREINQLLDKRSRKLEQKNKMDPLTGAYNRAGIEGSLAEAFSRWRVNRRPFSLLLIDVDHFKSVNDQYGHAVGDTVLRELSSLINGSMRADDRLARWGGEEFIVVCSDTTQNDALLVAEKVRSIVENATFADELHVTVSIGVAQIRSNETLDALFDRADKALYAAKDGGRNRVKTT